MIPTSVSDHFFCGPEVFAKYSFTVQVYIIIYIAHGVHCVAGVVVVCVYLGHEGVKEVWFGAADVGEGANQPLPEAKQVVDAVG